MLHLWRCILGSRICLTVGIAHYFPQRADKMRAPACPALPAGEPQPEEDVQQPQWIGADESQVHAWLLAG